MIALMIVVGDEAFDADVEVPRQEVVFQEDPVLQGLVPAFYLALGLRMVRCSTNMIHALLVEPISQFARDVAGSVVRQQAGFVANGNLITARSLKGQFQRVGDITSSHRRTQLPGDNISREVVQNGGEVIPAPANDLDVGKVCLPHLVDGGGLVAELMGSLEDNEGRTGDQIMSLEQAIH